jgi:16S rRNA (adenine1518-N6/adenine1519-N6)-dimethyltransferase
VSKTSIGSSSLPDVLLPPSGLRGPPEDREGVEQTLKGLGIVPSKRLGQSFLVDPFVADAEAALVDAPQDGPIVEIGGGLGTLTAALLRRGWSNITVIERDRRLANYLRRTFGGRVTVVEADALKVALPTRAAVVGNLPFSIGTALILKLLQARLPRVVVLVQREVADRLGAGPHSRAYGRLSILAQAFGTVDLYRVVPAEAFSPTPAVDGRIVKLSRRDGPLPVRSIERLESVVRALFASRRKQLRNLLPRLTGLPDSPEIVARNAGWPTDWTHLRPEDLPPEAFFRLANLLEETSNSPRTT